MRSSKSRSRSKPNRNRSVGNVVNRVFDSSGPEGKVRGTPQQIIDKYNQLARDAQLSGDRVAMENFQQHSEHYTRMLAEAQREQDARREQQEQQHRDRQQQQHNQPSQGDQREERQDRAGNDQPDQPDQSDRSNQPQPASRAQSPSQSKASRQSTVLDGDADVIDVDSGEDSGLVETPESKPAKPRGRRPRTPSASKPAEDPNSRGDGESDNGSAAAAE